MNTRRPTIPAAEVEKAEAIAGFAAGQKARATGHAPSTIQALGGYGKPTVICEELELLPLTVQVQLCLMECTKLYEEGGTPAPDTVLNGIKRLTRLAYCFADPERAYETLTQVGSHDDIRREFDLEAFALARYFSGAAEIDLLNNHISKEMGLLEAANPKLPEAQKKTRRQRPVASRH
jgi:hypothetical protein